MDSREKILFEQYNIQHIMQAIKLLYDTNLSIDQGYLESLKAWRYLETSQTLKHIAPEMNLTLTTAK